MNALRITGVTITPVALKDPPLLNSSGVHEPFALRSVVEVHTDAGITGINEAYGDDATLALLHRASTDLAGVDVFDLNELSRRVAVAVGGGSVQASAPTELIGPTSAGKTVAQAIAAFEVACYDAQGKATGLRVADLLGGAVRERVDFSAYLFYKWAEHPGPGSFAADPWGAALDPDGIVTQARRMVEKYGFKSLKLKGGVFAPEEEIEAVKALRREFPDRPVRLDPNANWTVPTSLRVAEALAGELEYLEDPTPGRPGMAEVAAKAEMPLATNMCVTGFEDIPESVRLGAVQVILSDHHFWGGFRATQTLAGLCQTFGLGLSMHSNTHLGLSLAAMVHLGAATPNLTYALDTHTPWKWESEDVVASGTVAFVDGAVAVPAGPGLGVELDRDALARLHEQYQTCGVRRRDDIGWMRRVHPDWTGKRPRF